MVINTMPRRPLLLWLALTVAGSLPAITVDPANVRVHAEAVRATFPRPEASAGEAELVAYIARVARAAGLTPRVLDFSNYPTGHSFSRVVEIVAPGSGSSTVMIVAPLNHPEDAGPDDDRSASVAAALSIMEAAASAGSRATYRFVFAGAEHGANGGYPKGTGRFLDTYFAEEPHALLYLDVSRLPPVVETGGGGRVAPSWLLRAVVDAAQANGVAPRVRSGLNQLHRLGISDAPRPLVDYLDAGIPAIYLRSGQSGLEPPAISEVASRLALMGADWADSFAAGVPDAWDRHYIYFQLGRRQVVIGERVFLIVLIALLGASLLYALVFRRQFARYLRTIGRNAWNIPVLFLLIFGFLTAATYLLELLLIARRFPTIWEYYPAAYFAFKITVSVFLFSVAAQLLRHLPLSKNGSFYSAAALFMLFIDIILFSVINLSFGYYFVWAFFWAFVFSVVRQRALKAIALLLAPYFLVRVAFEVLRIPELQLTEELLLSTRGDLLLSFMILPFLLMLIRLDFLVRHPVRGRRAFALRLASIGTGALVAGMLVFVLVSNPFAPSTPQPVTALERVDYEEFERTLTLSSPAPLGELRVLFAGEEYELDLSGREHTIASDLLPDVLSVRLSYEDFLDRDRASLRIDAPQPIDELEITFLSEEPMVLYDVSYPFAITPDRTRADVYVGKRPPLPLDVEFTVARGTAPAIDIVARSDRHPDPLEVTGRGLEASTRLEVRTRLGQ